MATQTNYSDEPAALGTTVRWQAINNSRRGPEDPGNPPHKIGDTVPVTCFAGRSGPVPLVRVTADLGPATSPDYWRFEGEVVGHQPTAPEPPAVSDQLGHHLANLDGGD